jgi:hypothetical protein
MPKRLAIAVGPMPSTRSRFTSAPFARAVAFLPFILAFSLSIGDALSLPFEHQLALELSNAPKHVEHQTPGWR